MRRATGLLVLALVLGGCAGTAPATDEGDSAAAPADDQQIEVEYADGRVSGDTGRVAVPAGSPVTITITSDVADQAHLHGYDLEAELAPGEPAELRFDADIPGVFELELHEAGTVLLTLQVG